MIRLALAAIFAASSAWGQACAPLGQVAEGLSAYGEAPVADGLDSNGRLILMWVNPETRTWTLTVTTGSGITCIVAAGQDYNPVRAEPNV